MPLIHIVLVLIVVGVLMWLINSFIPMEPRIKGLLNAVVLIALVIWLLQAFGLLGPISHFRVK
jgi:undecaprenyl pyrophosphate phosphatase UppP